MEMNIGGLWMQLPILTAKNWVHWNKVLCAVLLREGLWGIVKGQESLAEDASAEETQEFKDKQRKAFGLIMPLISKKLNHLIPDRSDDPRVLWKNLLQHFEPSNPEGWSSGSGATDKAGEASRRSQGGGSRAVGSEGEAKQGAKQQLKACQRTISCTEGSQDIDKESYTAGRGCKKSLDRADYRSGRTPPCVRSRAQGASGSAHRAVDGHGSGPRAECSCEESRSSSSKQNCPSEQQLQQQAARTVNDSVGAVPEDALVTSRGKDTQEHCKLKDQEDSCEAEQWSQGRSRRTEGGVQDLPVRSYSAIGSGHKSHKGNTHRRDRSPPRGESQGDNHKRDRSPPSGESQVASSCDPSAEPRGTRRQEEMNRPAARTVNSVDARTVNAFGTSQERCTNKDSPATKGVVPAAVSEGETSQGARQLIEDNLKDNLTAHIDPMCQTEKSSGSGVQSCVETASRSLGGANRHGATPPGDGYQVQDDSRDKGSKQVNCPPDLQQAAQWTASGFVGAKPEMSLVKSSAQDCTINRQPGEGTRDTNVALKSCELIEFSSVCSPDIVSVQDGRNCSWQSVAVSEGEDKQTSKQLVQDRIADTEGGAAVHSNKLGLLPRGGTRDAKRAPMSSESIGPRPLCSWDNVSVDTAQAKDVSLQAVGSEAAKDFAGTANSSRAERGVQDLAKESCVTSSGHKESSGVDCRGPTLSGTSACQPVDGLITSHPTQENICMDDCTIKDLPGGDNRDKNDVPRSSEHVVDKPVCFAADLSALVAHSVSRSTGVHSSDGEALSAAVSEGENGRGAKQLIEEKSSSEGGSPVQTIRLQPGGGTRDTKPAPRQSEGVAAKSVCRGVVSASDAQEARQNAIIPPGDAKPPAHSEQTRSPELRS